MRATCSDCGQTTEADWLPYYGPTFMCEPCADDKVAEKKFLRPINPDPVKAIAKEVHRGRPKTARREA